MHFVPALGLSMKSLLLIIFPVIIAVILLMGKFAPGALAAVPMRVIPDIMFGAVALTVAATFLSLWRRGLGEGADRNDSALPFMDGALGERLARGPCGEGIQKPGCF
jgi:hypothetical protein